MSRWISSSEWCGVLMLMFVYGNEVRCDDVRLFFEHRWTMKIFPFCSSELVYDSLQLAIAAREVDMRASPYDLTHYRRRQQHKEANQLDSTVTTSLGIGMSTEPIRVELPEVSICFLFEFV